MEHHHQVRVGNPDFDSLKGWWPLPESNDFHLDETGILAASRGALTGATELTHLNSCLKCQRDRDQWCAFEASMANTLVSQLTGSEIECPPAAILAAYLEGSFQAEVLERITECDRCAAIVGGVAQPAEVQTAYSLKTSTKDWRKNFISNHVRKTKKQTSRRVWLYVAASLLVFVLGGSSWIAWRGAIGPQRNLAESQDATRPFDYRLLDEAHGSATDQRGPESRLEKATDSPRALNAALNEPEPLGLPDAEIRRRFAAHPNDPPELRLYGQYQLLRRDFGGAIDSLTKASNGAPNDEQLLADLGTAYAVRGVAADSSADFGHAVQLFLKVLKGSPRDQRTLYNLALTYQKLGRADEAVSTWEKLQAENLNAEWRADVEVHLYFAEQMKREYKSRDRGPLPYWETPPRPSGEPPSRPR